MQHSSLEIYVIKIQILYVNEIPLEAKASGPQNFFHVNDEGGKEQHHSVAQFCRLHIPDKEL
jgi:hypothetical protein